MFLCSAMWCWKYLSSECEMWMGWKWITQQMRVQSRLWWQWLRMYWTWSLVLICEYKHSLIQLWLSNRFNSVNNRLRSFGWKNLSFLKTNFCSNSCSKHRESLVVSSKTCRVQRNESSSHREFIESRYNWLIWNFHRKTFAMCMQLVCMTNWLENPFANVKRNTRVMEEHAN